MFSDLVSWVCRSPRRLIVTAISLLIVVLAGGGALLDNNGVVGESSGQGDDLPAAAPTAVPGAQVPDAAPYIVAAVAFVSEWSQLKDGENADDWHSRVEPLVTTELAEALRTTDPANLPGVAPAGQPVVRFVSQTSALIAVPLSNGSSVLATVVLGGTEPLVSDIQPNLGD